MCERPTAFPSGGGNRCVSDFHGCVMLPRMHYRMIAISDSTMTCWQDFRYIARRLRVAPRFAAAALASLALMIGISTLAFGIVYGVLLQPLPFDRSVDLVTVGTVNPSARSGRTIGPLSLPEFEEFRRQSQTLSIAASTGGGGFLEHDGPPQRVSLSLITPNYFEVLHVRPVVGHLIDSEELLLDGTKPAMISFDYWQRNWGGSPSVIGEMLTLETFPPLPPLTIVGVLPSSFRSPGTGELPYELWTAVDRLALNANRRIRNQYVIGRLRPGETVVSAQADMNLIAARQAEEYPDTAREMRVRSALDGVISTDARRATLIFAAAVAVIFLVGLLNLVNLSASRLLKLQRELAIHSALGASRYRLVRQTVLEATILTLGGATLGLVLVYLTLDLVLASVPPVLPRLADVTIDGRVVAFGVGLALLSGSFIGLVPAFRASRLNLNECLKDGAPGQTVARYQTLLRNMLVVSHTSIAVVLLVGAGLLIESFSRLVSVDLGFDPSHVVTAEVQLPRGYTDGERRQQFFATVLQGIRSLPGVGFVAVSSGVPIAGGGLSTIVQGDDPARVAGTIIRATTSEYASVLGIPLVAGRWFNDYEVAGRIPVAVVSESIAQTLWPGLNPLGRFLRRARPANSGATITVRGDGGGDQEFEVLGVVRDIRDSSMDRRPQGAVYVPITSEMLSGPSRLGAITFLYRDSGMSQALVQGRILQQEPRAAVTVLSMEHILSNDLQRSRFQTVVLASFATAASVLTLLGIYSVVGLTTVQRTRELGVRMVLGASPSHLVRHVVLHGIVPGLTGIGIGLLLSVALTPILTGYLFEIRPAESPVYFATAVGSIVTVGLAAWVPARRAAMLDPSVVLRNE